MTIRLRLISGEDDEFFRDIEISGKATFLDLHQFIQELLNFDEGQMASFVFTVEDWQKNEEITLMDMAFDETCSAFIMSDVPINQFVSQNKQRLLYVFDFFNERNLFIEAYDIQEAECEMTKCIRANGDAPQQVDLSHLLAESDEEMPNAPADFNDEDIMDFDEEDFDDNGMISYTDDLEDLY